jgi:KUP system potassium uptake protein
MRQGESMAEVMDKPTRSKSRTLQIPTKDGGEERLLALSLGAIGVVFGDIGTSPLYTLREAFHGPFAIVYSPDNVLGVISLIFWSLIVVISIKYLLVIMRADNHGEGGILALVALMKPWQLVPGSLRSKLLFLGLFGAALLYGDSTITPAISVLSAMEGINVATPNVEHYVVPTSLLILLALFWFQSHGTARVGAVFGPIMLLWFVTLAGLGIYGIQQDPSILWALNPEYAIALFLHNGSTGLMVLGAVFLAITGGEALYADMGHFGPLPIRVAWFVLILPALTLNYFGQGALLLHDPSAVTQPFYHLAPDTLLYPLVILSTLAAIIASQAVITGAFSLTRQAIQLGMLPRMTIIQTSAEEYGQVYIPVVNWLLMLATLALVVGFGSSARLAAAYGIAVSADMVITTLLTLFLGRALGFGYRWIMAACIGFLLIDLSFLAANMVKIIDGGWYALLVALLLMIVMTTWRRGREILRQRLYPDTEPLKSFLARLRVDKPGRVPGTAVFLTAQGPHTPPMLIHHLQHNKVLHEKVILVTVVVESVPRLPASQRLHIDSLGQGFYRVTIHYGFNQAVNIPVALRLAEEFGLKIDPDNTTYYVGRETLIPSKKLVGMALWRERLFAILSRNATSAIAYYGLPVERVVELGIQVEI